MTSRATQEERLRDLARLRRVRDRIDREYAQPLDVEALARGAHMSAGHLSREFRLAYGESPYSSPPRTSTAPSSGCRPATLMSSRSRPTSRTGSATAPSAIPRATWSASRSCAEPFGVDPAVSRRARSRPVSAGRASCHSRPHRRSGRQRTVGAAAPTKEHGRSARSWSDRARRRRRRPRRRPRPTDGDTMSTATRTDPPSPPLHVADSHDLIRVHGARENNLKDVDVEIPKRRLTVFTGVSGSGKSSLVFDTIAAESQRLINETYSAFVQGFMPTLARPEVDLLEGLTTAIIVDQERIGANARSTVGTVTDANAMLRVLFSRLGSPYVGPPTAFSFNVPTRKASGVMTTEKGGVEH